MLKAKEKRIEQPKYGNLTGHCTKWWCLRKLLTILNIAGFFLEAPNPWSKAFQIFFNFFYFELSKRGFTLERDG